MISRRLLPALLSAAGMACAHVQRTSESVRETGVQASQVELNTMVVELGHETMRQIEIAADSIDSLSTDPGIRRNTLLWRVSSVPATTEAVLRPDLVISMLDLYAFRLQLSDFLASAAGSAAFGDAIDVALHAMDRLSREWEAVVMTAGGSLSDSARVKLAEWAREHPIDRLPFTRSSLAGPLAVRLRGENASMGAVMGSMQAQMDRLEARMSLANEYVPKQVGWMARIAAVDARGSPEALELTSTLSSARRLIDSTPGLIDRQRRAMLADIDRQRRETLVSLAQEREILLQSVGDQRAQILAAVDEQRRLIVHDADSLRAQLVADGNRFVDHLILRLGELLGGLLLVLGGWSLFRRRLRGA